MLRMWPYVASGGILVSLLELRTVFYPTHMEECEVIALEGVSHVVQRVGPARRPARLAAKLETTSSPVSGSHIAILCRPGVCTLYGRFPAPSLCGANSTVSLLARNVGKTRSADWNSQKYSSVLTRACMLFITKL